MRVICCMLILAFASNRICEAQNVFCIGGDLDHLTHDERVACQTQVIGARDLASRYHSLQNWHFVVVCGESSWKTYSSFAHERSNYLRDAVADTNQVERVTFLRGAAISSLSPDPRILEALSRLDAQATSTLAKTNNNK